MNRVRKCRPSAMSSFVHLFEGETLLSLDGGGGSLHDRSSSAD